MSKLQKDFARKSLETALKKALKPNKFKAEFVGIEENKKGNFFYAVVGVDLEIKTDTGIIFLNKDIQIPLSMKDVDIIIPEEKPKAPAKPKTETSPK